MRTLQAFGALLVFAGGIYISVWLMNHASDHTMLQFIYLGACMQVVGAVFRLVSPGREPDDIQRG